MVPVPDDTTSSLAKKPVELEDLPPKERGDEIVGDVKGGATIEPCIRAPRRNVTNLETDPCWRPGGSSAL